MTRPIRLLLVFLLTACTLEEPARLEPKVTFDDAVVLRGETAVAAIESDAIDALTLTAGEVVGIRVTSQRIDDRLEVALDITEQAALGATSVPLTFNANGREASADLTFTVAQAALSFAQPSLSLPVGETASVGLSQRVEGVEAELQLDASEGLSITPEADALQVTPLTPCLRCTVTATLRARGEPLRSATLEVDTEAPPNPEVSVEPTAFTLQPGQQSAGRILLDKTAVGDVALTLDEMPGVDFSYPEQASESVAFVALVSADATPGLREGRVTAQAGDRAADAVFYILVEDDND